MSEVAAPAAPSSPSSSSSGSGSSPTAPKTPAASAPSEAGAPVLGKQPPTDAAPPEKAEPAEPKPEKRKYRYKANKEEYEEELSDEEIAQRLSKVRGSERAFQERAQLEKSVQAFIEAVKQDPFSVLSDPNIGVDLEKLAEERLAQKYRKVLEEAEMSPEQREAKEAREEAERYKKQVAEFEEQRRQVAVQQYEEKLVAKTRAEFEAALEALGEDASWENVAEMAAIAKENLQIVKYDPTLALTPAQLAAEARDRIQERNRKHEAALRQRVSGLKGNDLVSYLGEDVVKEIIRAKLEGMKAPVDYRAQPPAQQPKVEEKKPFDRAAWRRKNILGLED
jgi:hypothetical protein